MKEKVRFLGLDVHAETIAVAVAEPDGEVRSLGTIANREESIRNIREVTTRGPLQSSSPLAAAPRSGSACRTPRARRPSAQTQA